MINGPTTSLHDPPSPIDFIVSQTKSTNPNHEEASQENSQHTAAPNPTECMN